MNTRSKTYLELASKVEAGKIYSPTEALALIVDTSKSKFDGTIELHIRLGIDPKKGGQQVRGTLTLPHGTGKVKRVAAFVDVDNEKLALDAGADMVGGEELITEIGSSGKIDFDEAVATPQMMPKLAKIAKILGPKGIMPSPKSETVGTDVNAMVKAIKAGKISFKNDDTANLHLAIGKISFGNEKLQENFNSAMEIIKKAKPQTSKGVYIKKVSLSSTMSPSIQVETSN
jgi:large subunit ribosomal protein L1